MSVNKNSNRLIKYSGQVFTPDFLVSMILDYASYISGNIIRKHVMDNSCGDGAFLCEIVERYATDYYECHGNYDNLKNELQLYIHGIEIDSTAYNNCIYNLNALVQKYGIEDVTWDIIHGDALAVTRYDKKIDFVIGNPPYVRVHNLGKNYDAVKSFSFAQDGMTDLYLVFYELGLRMLNENGKLCYITPSSWLSSLAATNMRKYIMSHRNLVGLIDLGHHQAFEGATTYTMIALFDMKYRENTIEYYSYSGNGKEKVYVDTISYDEMSIDNKFYVGSKKDLALLKAIRTTSTNKYTQVKNGFATLADKIFILNVKFKNLTIPILKASTGKWYEGFFPYDKKGKPLSKDKIFSYPEISQYLNDNKLSLLKSKTEQENPSWYLYGRTQALKDVYAHKYSINSIIKDIDSIKLVDVPSGAGVYSGLYILSDVSYDIIERIIKSQDFINYLSILKNYKSGGYYSYSSRDLEQYLNYKISIYEKSRNNISFN